MDDSTRVMDYSEPERFADVPHETASEIDRCVFK